VDLKNQESVATRCVAGGWIYGTQVNHLIQPYCPAFVALKKGEKLKFLVTSNSFPDSARPTNNEKDKFYGPPRTAHVQLLHSLEYPSKVTIELEPKKAVSN
jgi:hypothetical protein